ncbi:hypothetical protein DD237_001065 [Peronospora effusa]|uniref:Uncharacterized protein n=1 Tax=Peronospora effusa TaxID=542832 RepID=A0A3R7Z022_9STRA|nr:hypothetical protein DD237_001065 [Peronospora effusa]
MSREHIFLGNCSQKNSNHFESAFPDASIFEDSSSLALEFPTSDPCPCFVTDEALRTAYLANKRGCSNSALEIPK